MGGFGYWEITIALPLQFFGSGDLRILCILFYCERSTSPTDTSTSIAVEILHDVWFGFLYRKLINDNLSGKLST